MSEELIKIIGRFQNHGRTSLFRQELAKWVENATHMELMYFGYLLHLHIQQNSALK